jgi:hypothetical protein
VAIDNTNGFPTLPFTKRWSQPGATISFGRPFLFHPELKHASRENLRLMTDEAMYLLAKLLPEYRRGYYSDLSQATQETIEYLTE